MSCFMLKSCVGHVNLRRYPHLWGRFQNLQNYACGYRLNLAQCVSGTGK